MTVSTCANNSLESLIQALPQGAAIFDYGCHGWRVYDLAKALGRHDIRHAGCDIIRPRDVPADISFELIAPHSTSIPAQDDKYDLVVASHVIEHLADPCAFFAEMARICRPGGKIYVEAPSDRAASACSDKDVESHSLLSFWDDPTHIRPWTPAAYYRLALSFGVKPIECAYVGGWLDIVLYPLRRLMALGTKNGDAHTQALWLAKKWLCVGVFEKPAKMQGKPSFRYVTLRGVDSGYAAAFKAVNGEGA